MDGSTVFVLRMAHGKWKETKQQPSMFPGPAVPGCCLVYFHILWAILSTSTVQCLHPSIGVPSASSDDNLAWRHFVIDSPIHRVFSSSPLHFSRLLASLCQGPMALWWHSDLSLFTLPNSIQLRPLVLFLGACWVVGRLNS